MVASDSMTLDVVVPRSWAIRVEKTGRRVATAPDTARGGISIIVAPIHPRPDNFLSLRDEGILRQAPSGATSAIVERADLLSAVGWPINVFDVESRRDGVVVERQLHIVYFLLEYIGWAYARVTRPEVYADLRGELLEVLSTGQPRWNADGEIVSVSQMWNGLPPVVPAPRADEPPGE